MNIALHHDTTGKRIVSVGGASCFTAWACLQSSIASHYEVPIDAVEMSEEDDGTEAVFVCGERRGHIVTVIGGHTFGVPANRNDDAAQAAVREVMESAS